jgi:flagellar hook-basal body complex protein FliE
MEFAMSPIGSIDSLLTQVQRAGSASAAVAPGAARGANADFTSAMSQALGNLSQVQNRATQLQQRFQMEDPNVSIEETMVATQKAQIGFQAAVQVRNKLVQSYTDIMNMPV